MRPVDNRLLTALVFATPIEAELAIEHLQAKPVNNHHHLLTGVHPESRQKIVLLITGMGLKPAYTAMISLLTTQPISKVINLGVAGSLQPNLQISDLCTINCARMEETPDKLFQDFNKIELAPLPHLPQHRLVSVHTPLFENKRRAKLATNADLVDMEGAAIAWSCQQHNIPCQMLKGITDFAGAEDKNTLYKNLSKVSNALTIKLFQQEDIFIV